MIGRFIIVLATSFVLFAAASGCAAQRSEIKGITRLGYTIQVGAFSEVKNAEHLVAQLQKKGIDAFYFRKDKGIYAVRFGDFPSWEAASKAANKLSGQRVIGSYFIADPQTAYLQKPRETELRREGSPRRSGGEDDMGTVAARTAERFVGIPYRWGGNNVAEGMDCSGFVRAVYNLCGVNIPRTSQEQYQVGETIGKEALRDGDLVFFGDSGRQINHVGIYIGNGRFVHAPRRRENIKISSLEENYFTRRFIGGRRYF